MLRTLESESVDGKDAPKTEKRLTLVSITSNAELSFNSLLTIDLGIFAAELCLA